MSLGLNRQRPATTADRQATGLSGKSLSRSTPSGPRTNTESAWGRPRFTLAKRRAIRSPTKWQTALVRVTGLRTMAPVACSSGSHCQAAQWTLDQPRSRRPVSGQRAFARGLAEATSTRRSRLAPAGTRHYRPGRQCLCRPGPWAYVEPHQRVKSVVMTRPADSDWLEHFRCGSADVRASRASGKRVEYGEDWFDLPSEVTPLRRLSHRERLPRAVSQTR